MFLVHSGVVFGERVTNPGMTTSIEEIRQRLEKAKAQYRGEDREAFARAIDSLVESLRAQYGEQVPVADAAKRLRELHLPSSETVSTAPGNAAAPVEKETTADGVRLEWTPGGFILRASCGSLVTGAPWAAFAVILIVIPFKLWGDLIRGVWTAEGATFWLTSAFLAIWAAAVLYVCATAAVGLFGEIRITKDGDRGEIFTGIAKAGRTHRLQWSEFAGIAERDEASASSGRYSHITRYVELNGSSKRYKFGSELTEPQQAFVMGFLREHVFGSDAAPVPTPLKR